MNQKSKPHSVTLNDGYIVIQRGTGHASDVPPFIAAWFLTKADAHVFMERYQHVDGYELHLTTPAQLPALLAQLTRPAQATLFQPVANVYSTTGAS